MAETSSTKAVVKEADNGTWRVSCPIHNMPEVDFISHPTYLGASGLLLPMALTIMETHNYEMHDGD